MPPLSVASVWSEYHSRVLSSCSTTHSSRQLLPMNRSERNRLFGYAYHAIAQTLWGAIATVLWSANATLLWNPITSVLWSANATKFWISMAIVLCIAISTMSW